MKALQEQSLCLTEKIDDVYHIAANNLYQDPKKLWAIFEEIYHHSKSYEEYALSLQDSLNKAQAIATCEKRIINISDMIQKTFANKYAYFSVQHSLPGKTNLMKALIQEAVEASIDSLLEIGLKEDYHINLKIQPNCTIIEIILDTTEHKLDQDQVQQSLEKARLFALLDEGLIGIYRTENHLVFTLVYNYTDSNPDISADCPAEIRFSKDAKPL